METSTQLERERLRELLTNRIQSGEQLRRELTLIFNESAKLLLVPAIEDIRAAGATALRELGVWKKSMEDALKEFDAGNKDALSRHDQNIRDVWTKLEADISQKMHAIAAALENGAASWAQRYQSTNQAVSDCLSRLEPATKQICGAAESLQVTAATVSRDAAAALREISYQGRDEARRVSMELKDSLGALLLEFTGNNAAAFNEFTQAYAQLLGLLKEQTAGTRSGWASTHDALAHLEAGGGRITAAIAVLQNQTETAAKRIQETVLAGASSTATLIQEDNSRNSASLQKLSESVKEGLGVVRSAIASLDQQTFQAIVAESSAVQDKIESLHTEFRASWRSLEQGFAIADTAAKDREMLMARIARQRFWITVILIFGVAFLDFVIRR